MSAADDATRRNEIVGAGRARISSMREASWLDEQEFDALCVLHALTADKSSLASFELLIRQLLQKSQGKNFIVGVTGLERGVGCSYTALNLAATLAMDHHRTSMLIECSSHSWTLDQMIRPKPEVNLRNYLLDDSIDATRLVYAAGISRMRAVPYGETIIPERLLNSIRMRELLSESRERYTDRFLIVDLPPVESLGRLKQLMEVIDYSMLVVPYGVSARRVKSAKKALGNHPLAGLVMNRVPG